MDLSPVQLGQFACVTVFAGALGVAVVTDLASFRIPNPIPLAIGAAFAVAAPLAGLEWSAVGLHVLAGLVLLVAGLGLAALTVFGGGDIKLLAAVGLWSGFERLPFLLAAVSMAGGILALVVLLLRRLPAGRGPAVVQRLRATPHLPYGVAIAVGGWLMILRSWSHTPLFNAGLGAPGLGGG